MTESDRDPVKDLEDRIRQLSGGEPERALADLTAVAQRAVVEIHKLAREESNRRRGTPEWGKWARLANAARSGVLQMAAVRDSVKGIVGRPPPATDSKAGQTTGDDGP